MSVAYIFILQFLYVGAVLYNPILFILYSACTRPYYTKLLS